MQFIYSRTSLYPGQRMSLSDTDERRVRTAASEILYLTQPRWGAVRPIAFSNLLSLFICGTALTAGTQKERLLSVLEAMDAEACGRNFACAATALRTLYEAQASERVHDARLLDWWVVLGAKGLLDFSLYGI